MITVAEADHIIQSEARSYGTEEIPFESSVGRVLADKINADRDQPPYDRVTMDGIAISYEAFAKGIREFLVIATQAAGETPVNISKAAECIEIMTGAALPHTMDTIIRYEDLDITDQKARIKTEEIKKGQNIHFQGKDRKKSAIVSPAYQIISPALINMAASVGLSSLSVMKLPRVVVISSGDELVDINSTPSPFQVRRSNNYSIRAALLKYGLNAAMLHIPDDPAAINQQIEKCLHQYDVVILSGGVSMGKFDYIPQALENLAVTKLFHKVKQRPGKPFWFGTHPKGTLVFAFPGNPVATFMCLYRYFIPWLETSLKVAGKTELHAKLEENFVFDLPLQYFLQIKLRADSYGQLLATPVEGNGSGDFANLLDSNAFMELPAEQNNFKKGNVYRVWPFGQL